jgi:serine/threonine-protein kinase
MADPSAPATAGLPLEPDHSWAWDSADHDEDPAPAPPPTPELSSLPDGFLGSLGSADPIGAETSAPPASSKRPALAIEFAQEPDDDDDALASAFIMPLQDRIAGRTGQRIEIELHHTERRHDRKAPLELPLRYLWLDTLGEGGQGTVELVLDADLGRPVALKTLLPTKTGDRHLLDLYREARITGQLDHPHIITLYDVGQLPDDRLYYTMPPMPGENLHNVLVRLRRAEAEVVARWGLVPLVQVLLKACHGVGYAHSRGVIHRDLKPANILLGDHGEVLVVDWGIARVADDADVDDPSLRRLWSHEGEPRRERVRGSPPYMAPEQIQHPDQVGPAADVFCLGVMLYEAITRLPPWTGSDVDSLVDGLCHATPVAPRERAPAMSIPAELEEICLRALEKFPGHRYANATDLAAALEDWLAGGQRRDAAERHLREAKSMRDRHRSLRTRSDDARRKLAAARAPVGSDEAVDTAVLQELAGRADSVTRASDGVLSEAVWALRRALAADPDHPAIHDLLAEMYADRYGEAERRGADREQAWFRALLRQFDGGRWGRWLRTGGELTVSAVPEDGRLTVVRLNEQDGRQVPGETLEASSEGVWQLAVGRYALTRAAPDPAATAWFHPFRIEREDRLHLVLELQGEEDAGDELRFVPGATAIVGGDPLASGSGKQRRVRNDPFTIGRYPVTVGAYARFLAWVGDDRPGVARRHRPADFDRQLADGERRPVRNVSAANAEAYCTWLSEATRRTIRLPTADEWEHAARGADARAFPWGDRFDPSRCASLWSGAPGSPPPAVGLFVDDCSPYGVGDLAGGVWEWTGTSPGGRQIVVGGAIISEEAACRSAVRRALMPGETLPFLGFRVVMEVG